MISHQPKRPASKPDPKAALRAEMRRLRKLARAEARKHFITKRTTT
jgi:hypothetical protein